MTVNSYSYLTWSIVSRFGDRKDIGFVSLLIDVNSGLVYVVPHKKEHVDLAGQILSLDRQTIKENPELVSHLVPSTLEIKEESVYGVTTGVSGIEMGYGVRHSSEQLETAHSIARKFIEEGEIPPHEEFKEVIIRRWQAK